METSTQSFWAHRKRDESRIYVVNHSYAKYFVREAVGIPDGCDVDPHRRMGVCDTLRVEGPFVDPEEAREPGPFALHAQDPAVGVLQNDEGPSLVEVPTGSLRQLPQPHNLVQHGRRDPSTDVAQHGRLTQIESEELGRVNPGVDAADDEDFQRRKDFQARGESVGREACVALYQLLNGITHGYSSHPSHGWDAFKVLVAESTLLHIPLAIKRQYPIALIGCIDQSIVVLCVCGIPPTRGLRSRGHRASLRSSRRDTPHVTAHAE